MKSPRHRTDPKPEVDFRKLKFEKIISDYKPLEETMKAIKVPEVKKSEIVIVPPQSQ